MGSQAFIYFLSIYEKKKERRTTEEEDRDPVDLNAQILNKGASAIALSTRLSCTTSKRLRLVPRFTATTVVRRFVL